MASRDQAAVRFENRTAKGVIEPCGWVRVEGDSIKEILSPDEQESLGELLLLAIDPAPVSRFL